MSNIDINKPLLECLKQFKAPEEKDYEARKKDLEEDFVLLAKKLLYGGYFIVSDKKQEKLRIEINSIEFYYHDEKEDLGNNRIYDWIMYHRNTKSGGKKVPYETGTLNAHVSGIDITFEDYKEGLKAEEVKYRASALIRSFKVIFNQKSKKEILEEHPTKLYDYLFMQVPLPDLNIHWQNKEQIDPKSKLYKGKRINVFKYDNNDPSKKNCEILDKREWAFSKEKRVVKHDKYKTDNPYYKYETYDTEVL